MTSLASAGFLTPPNHSRKLAARPPESSNGVSLRTGGGADPPRLFDALAAKIEPRDITEYYGKQEGEGKGLWRKQEFEDNLKHIFRLRFVTVILCSSQAVIALLGLSILFFFTPSHSATANFVMCTSLFAATSSIVGVVSAVKKQISGLQWFFLSQIFCLTMMLGQWLRGVLASKNEQLFCDDRAGGETTDPLCRFLPQHTQSTLVALALGFAYVSMFVADSLSEGLQDQREQEDHVRITKFVWNMNKKTVIGIHRFEESIHKKFEELVNLGYLKLKAPSPNSSPQRRSSIQKVPLALHAPSPGISPRGGASL